MPQYTFPVNSSEHELTCSLLIKLPLLLTWLILVDRDAVYGFNSHVHLLITATIVICLFLWTEMLYME